MRNNAVRSFVGLFFSLAFLWALTLSASPQLHNRLHADANRAEHSCAVTMIASGSYDHTAPVALVNAPAPIIRVSFVSMLNRLWVQSPFLGASVFEHAPPLGS